MPMDGDSKLHWWYLGLTPVFAIFDFAFDLSLRAAAFEDPSLRLYYYGGLLVVGALCWRAPALAPLATMLESAFAIGALVVSAYLTIIRLPDQLDAAALGMPWVTNLLLCGLAGIYAFHRAHHQLREHGRY